MAPRKKQDGGVLGLLITQTLLNKKLADAKAEQEKIKAAEKKKLELLEKNALLRQQRMGQGTRGRRGGIIADAAQKGLELAFDWADKHEAMFDDANSIASTSGEIKEIQKKIKQLQSARKRRSTAQTTRRGGALTLYNQALKIYNQDSNQYCVPKKGTPEYNEVVKIMNALKMKDNIPTAPIKTAMKKAQTAKKARNIKERKEKAASKKDTLKAIRDYLEDEGKEKGLTGNDLKFYVYENLMNIGTYNPSGKKPTRTTRAKSTPEPVLDGINLLFDESYQDFIEDIYKEDNPKKVAQKAKAKDRSGSAKNARKMTLDNRRLDAVRRRSDKNRAEFIRAAERSVDPGLIDYMNKQADESGYGRNARKMKIDNHALMRATVNARRAKKRNLEGKGIMDDIGAYAVNTLDAVRGGVRNGPSPSLRRLLNKYGDQKIVSVTVQRAPVQSAIKTVANLLTGGKFTKTMEILGYDDIFHLSMLLHLESGKVLRYEKNEVVKMSESGTFTGEQMPAGKLRKPITVMEFIDNTLKEVGRDRYYLYSAEKWNCQLFLLDHLRVNGINTPQLEKFIMQDAVELLQNNPTLIGAARKVTDLGALFDVVKEGRGIGGDVGSFLSDLIAKFIGMITGKSDQIQRMKDSYARWQDPYANIPLR